MAYKVDFHTHSVASPDGALTATQYRQILEKHTLDAIAVTDHNTIAFALQLHEALGDAIIVGEEITTIEGEIIGLYLTEPIAPMLTLQETVDRIKKQGGLVYVPHPFETVRSGIKSEMLDVIAGAIDAVEIYNGRALFQNYSAQAQAWAKQHTVPGAAASDSHGKAGWGKTYTLLSEMPTRENLVRILKQAEYRYAKPGIRTALYPKINRLRKTLRRRHD